tara:strand:- start:347 stop:586 length:240 start_codon:yes stop_codon:yes gene_type:complete
MPKLRTENVKIISEFVGALMKAYARGGAKKTLKKIQRDPVIKRSLERIAQLDKEIKKDVAARIKKDPQLKKDLGFFKGL